MIVLIISGALLFFNNIFHVILPDLTTPLDTMATNVVNFGTFLVQFITYLINVAGAVMDFVCELFAIPVDLFNAMCFYLAAKLTIPIIAASIKLILRWYQSLMPTK